MERPKMLTGIELPRNRHLKDNLKLIYKEIIGTNITKKEYRKLRKGVDHSYGTNFTSIREQLMTSTEGKTRLQTLATQNHTDAVRHIYRHLLGRGIDGDTGARSAYIIPRKNILDVLTAVMNSEEYRKRKEGSRVVWNTYLQVLGRYPDRSGHDSYTLDFQRDRKSAADINTAIRNSREYQSRKGVILRRAISEHPKATVLGTTAGLMLGIGAGFFAKDPWVKTVAIIEALQLPGQAIQAAHTFRRRR